LKIIKLTSLKNTEISAEIVNNIKEGGIIVYPTDTLYGIGGVFSLIEVVEKIDKIKGRGDKPYSIAVSDFEMLKRFVSYVPKVFKEKFIKLLPGKYTFLFEAKEDIDKSLLKESKKIGIRIPDQPIILKLIKEIGLPIITTSVNRSGEKPINSFNSILDFIEESKLEKSVDIIIDGGILPNSKGSTIIDLTNKTPEYIRT